MNEKIHTEIKNTLAAVVERGTVSHTYLFYGPQGVGKAGLAGFFARSLLCLKPREGQSCGICLACRKVDGGNHPDLMLLSPQGSSFRIEQVRELQRLLQLKPFEGGRRIVVVQGAQMLTQAAANSLLKTLEEPPQGTVFILLSDNPYNLPNTVLSRCQMVRVKPVPPAQIEEILIAEGMEQARARLVALLSGGLPERARELAGEEGAHLREDAYRAWEKICSGQTLALLNLAEEWEKEKEKIIPFLDILVLWARDLAIWQKTGNPSLLFNVDRQEDMQAQTAKFYRADWTGILKVLEEAKGNLKSYANSRLVLEALFLQIKGMVA